MQYILEDGTRYVREQGSLMETYGSFIELKLGESDQCYAKCRLPSCAAP